MKKSYLVLGLVVASALILTGCGNSKSKDCEKACANVPSEQKAMCLSTCQKAAAQYEQQGKNAKGNLGGGNNECYAQCDAWGGGSQNVSMCKQNCDASADPNSVWNQEEDDNANDTTFSDWSGMPSEVPEFTYGNFVMGEIGMGSWIADFNDVSDEALNSYTNDLKNAGWSAGKIEVSGMITGSYEGETGYSITVNIDRYENVAQVIVRKKN